MLPQEGVLNFPLVYPSENSSNSDQHIPKLNRVRAIQQRIQETGKKLQVLDDNHKVICQMANGILKESNIEL